MKLTAPAALLTAGLLAAACSSASHPAAVPPASHAPASRTPARHTPAAVTPSAAAPVAVPLLLPGHHVTFTVRQQTDLPARVEWIMSPRVIRAADGTGMSDAAFALTVRNVGTVAVRSDPTFQTDLQTVSPARRLDQTIAQSAGLAVHPGTRGLPPTDLTLESGLAPGQFSYGTVVWIMPAGPQTVELLDNFAGHLALKIKIPG